jgi:hypothetical protein
MPRRPPWSSPPRLHNRQGGPKAEMSSLAACWLSEKHQPSTPALLVRLVCYLLLLGVLSMARHLAAAPILLAPLLQPRQAAFFLYIFK